MAVSTTDKNRLSSDQQSAVQNYTDQYYAAKARGDTQGMQAAHAAAEGAESGGILRRSKRRREHIRPPFADRAAGAEPILTSTATRTRTGRMSSAGRSIGATTMTRRIIFDLRRTLFASRCWRTRRTGTRLVRREDKDYLHQQNLALNNLLNQYAGGVESQYDPKTGKWYTERRSRIWRYRELRPGERQETLWADGSSRSTTISRIRTDTTHCGSRTRRPIRTPTMRTTASFRATPFHRGATPGSGAGNSGARMGYGERLPILTPPVRLETETAEHSAGTAIFPDISMRGVRRQMSKRKNGLTTRSTRA